MNDTQIFGMLCFIFLFIGFWASITAQAIGLHGYELSDIDYDQHMELKGEGNWWDRITDAFGITKFALDMILSLTFWVPGLHWIFNIMLYPLRLMLYLIGYRMIRGQ